jgi:hypothetical protein
MPTRKLPNRNVVLILIFGAGIILFVLLSIFPNYIAYSNITQQIETLKGQIEEQKILSPIFNDLTEKAKFIEPVDLPFPDKEKLPKNETGKLSAIIQDIIERNGFELKKIATDVDSLMQESGKLKLNVQMLGDFMNLRPIFLQLGALPYLDHIESMKIEGKNGQSDVQLTLWIAQQL